MFVYQKRIRTVEYRGRKIEINMLTVRTPSMLIPGGSLLVGELEEESVRMLGLNSALASENQGDRERTEGLLRQIYDMIQDPERESETGAFAYFAGGGWSVDVVCFTADEVNQVLEENQLGHLI